MGRDTGGLREEVRRRLADCGALAVGFARAGKVADSVMKTYDGWISGGANAGMEYMANHREVREDPRLLLKGARTVISMAFSYNSQARRDPSLPAISKYAFLPDYHKWIRKMIRKSGVGELLGEEHSDWRICVDSAPIFERYWAQEAGIAIIGNNGSAIVPGVGCEVFLAEIVCRMDFEPDRRLEGKCGACGACREACPAGAMGESGNIDCNRCISYLTIEHCGEMTDRRHVEAMQTDAGRSTLFGCDRCISVCPHNNAEIISVAEPMSEVVGYKSGPIPSGSCLKRASNHR